MKIVITQTKVERQLVQALRTHFTEVLVPDEIQTANVIQAPMRERNNGANGNKQNVVRMLLGVKNMVNMGCYQHIFTNCRVAKPRSLTINAQLSGPEEQLCFSHADSRVAIPNITIGR